MKYVYRVLAYLVAIEVAVQAAMVVWGDAGLGVYVGEGGVVDKTLAESGESLPLTQLAERLSCVKSNITQLVDRLEADGLVRRLSDPNDRRARLATLTAAGRKACKDGLRVQQDAEQNLLRKLSASESRTLADLLAKVAGR